MRPYRYAAVLLIALSMSLASATTTTQNDAGSGTDAGNTMDTALRLAALGTYQGVLVGGEDSADWYLQKRPKPLDTPLCIEAGLSSDLSLRGRLVAVTGTQVREVVADHSPLRSARMGIAAPGHSGGFLGIESTAAIDVGKRTPYDFTWSSMRASSLADGDGGSGGDAGATAATAVPVPGGCFGGSIGGADTSDVYTFSGRLGDRLVLSVVEATNTTVLSLRAPDGQTLLSLASEGLGAVDLPLTGTYTLTATSTSSDMTTYVIGMCEPNCRPPANGCRPHCLEILGTDS